MNFKCLEIKQQKNDFSKPEFIYPSDCKNYDLNVLKLEKNIDEFLSEKHIFVLSLKEEMCFTDINTASNRSPFIKPKDNSVEQTRHKLINFTLKPIDLKTIRNRNLLKRERSNTENADFFK